MSVESDFLESIPKDQAAYLENIIDFLKKIYSEEELSDGRLEHFIKTGAILVEFDLDKEVVATALLHEVLTDKKTTYEELEERFGERVASLAKESSEIGTIIEGNIDRAPLDVLNSIVLSIAVDLEALMIRIAAVVNVLEDPAQYHRVKIDRIARIGKDVYLPLAMKLGMGGVQNRLQDSAFKIENPSAYNKIKKYLGKNDEERITLIEEVKKELYKLIGDKLKVQIFGRPKGYLSIYNKMKKINFKNIYDLYGLRILCNSEKECYELLGIVHANYKIIPGAFDDYISKPKNGYKSLHTAIFREGDIIEVQIRTWVDHLKIESNLYWEYKSISKNREFEKNLSWERQLVEWQKSLGKDTPKRKMETEKIFVFTPKKEIITLKKGSCVIDFAYAIHTDIGHKLKRGKINGEFVPVDTKLKNLDKVEVVVDNKPQVNASWISIVKSEKAKAKIRSYLGIKGNKLNIKKKERPTEALMKKIKMADCCHPLPGEDVVGFKTTKRKIIIHKRDCENLKKLDKNRLIEIEFEKDKGKTELRLVGIDRIDLLGELLTEIKKSGALVVATNFKIKKTGYVEVIFGIEIKSVKKLENLMERLARIPSIHSVERL